MEKTQAGVNQFEACVLLHVLYRQREALARPVMHLASEELSSLRFLRPLREILGALCAR